MNPAPQGAGPQGLAGLQCGQKYKDTATHQSTSSEAGGDPLSRICVCPGTQRGYCTFKPGSQACPALAGFCPGVTRHAPQHAPGTPALMQTTVLWPGPCWAPAATLPPLSEVALVESEVLSSPAPHAAVHLAPRGNGPWDRADPVCQWGRTDSM